MNRILIRILQYRTGEEEPGQPQDVLPPRYLPYSAHRLFLVHTRCANRFESQQHTPRTTPGLAQLKGLRPQTTHAFQDKHVGLQRPYGVASTRALAGICERRYPSLLRVTATAPAASVSMSQNRTATPMCDRANMALWSSSIGRPVVSRNACSTP